MLEYLRISKTMLDYARFYLLKIYCAIWLLPIFNKNILKSKSKSTVQDGFLIFEKFYSSYFYLTIIDLVKIKT